MGGIPQYSGSADSLTNHATGVAGETSTKTTTSQEQLKNQMLIQQHQAHKQPVDRPIASSVKGKNQFICSGKVF